MTERIKALAEAMGAPASQEELLTLLCQAAEAELRGKLKAGVTPEDCESAFLAAAAWMALAGLKAGDAEADVTAFTAGDVTIRREGGGDGTALRGQALRLMAPYLADDTFSFRGAAG